MVKSGSMFLMRGLQNGLKAKSSYSICAGPENNNFIYEPALANLAHGHLLTYSHIFPSEYNQATLAKYLDRMVVLARDPRQATLSHVHHVEKEKMAKDRAGASFVNTPGYFDRDLSGKIDHHLDVWLPYLVKWLSGWVDAEAADDFPVRLRFLTFEELRADKDRVFRDILDFYEIDRRRFTPPQSPKVGQAHFRAGKTDEWRSVFSEEQIRKANEAVPHSLLAKFNWVR